MGLDIVIPLFVLIITLLPNLLIIWLLSKLRVSQRLGRPFCLLCCWLSIPVALISYFAIAGAADQPILSLVTAGIAAIMSLIAISYFISKKDITTKITGLLLYFAILVYCEMVVFGVLGHM